MYLSQVKVKSSKPKYIQIKESLMTAIEDQELMPGEQIPSLEELSKLNNVSRMTARQAIQELVYEGILYTVVGKGTYVTQRKRFEPLMNTIWGFTDSFSSSDDIVESRLLAFEVQPADSDVSRNLEIPQGSNVFKLYRIRNLNRKPVGVEMVYLPVDRFPSFDQFDWNHVSLYSVLRDNYQIKLEKGYQFIESGAASSEIAGLLEIQPKSPLLMMDRIIKTSEGWVVEYAHTFYRADSLRLSINISSDEPLTLVKAESY